MGAAGRWRGRCLTPCAADAGLLLLLARRKLGVETPIIDGIYRVIHEEADAQRVVVEVMTRELREEVDPLVMAAAAQPAA